MRRKIPLVVMLHGCLQDPAVFAAGTRMSALADQFEFAVLYPQQESSANRHRCWNWHLPDNQRPEGPEPAMLMSMIDQAIRDHGLDAERVFVAGISAGAAMASTMTQCYPTRFAAAFLFAGVGYGRAQDKEAAGLAMSGKLKTAPAKSCVSAPYKLVPTMVVQGAKDRVVHHSNADAIVDTLRSLAGDLPEVKQNTYTAPDGTSYTMKAWGAPQPPFQIVQVDVEGLGHAWSGGDSRFPFAAEEGPDASALAWDFFRKWSRQAH